MIAAMETLENEKAVRLLRVKEAADVLGVKSPSVRQLSRRGTLPSVRDWNGHRRFREPDVIALRESLLAKSDG
jgi:excisionase family DNA binding protein